MKGLSLWVFRSELGNCTNGPTQHCAKVTLVGVQLERGAAVTPLPTNSQQFEATKDCPAVVLRASNVPGGPPVLVLAEHAVDGPGAGLVGPMFGGNYAAGSDGRVGDAAGLFGEHWRHIAFAVHDRTETQAQYDALSY